MLLCRLEAPLLRADQRRVRVWRGSCTRCTRSFLTPDALALVMHDKSETIDIDTKEDWVNAEMYLESHVPNKVKE